MIALPETAADRHARALAPELARVVASLRALGRHAEVRHLLARARLVGIPFDGDDAPPEVAHD